MDLLPLFSLENADETIQQNTSLEQVQHLFEQKLLSYCFLCFVQTNGRRYPRKGCLCSEENVFSSEDNRQYPRKVRRYPRKRHPCSEEKVLSSRDNRQYPGKGRRYPWKRHLCSEEKVFSSGDNHLYSGKGVVVIVTIYFENMFKDIMLLRTNKLH
jgi:hypothetical protein